MSYLILVLRLIHILAGVFWVGAALMMTLYIGPAASATGEAGQKFMQHFISKTNIQKMLMAAGGTTVIAGAALYVDKPAAWFSSGAGIGFGIGASFAIVGFAFGILISRNMRVLGQLGAQIQGQPNPDELAQMQRLQGLQRSYSTINSISLILAVAFMATARYFTF